MIHHRNSSVAPGYDDLRPDMSTSRGISPRMFRARSRTRAVLFMPIVFLVSACLIAFALIAALVGTASWGVAKALPKRAPADPKAYLPPEDNR